MFCEYPNQFRKHYQFKQQPLKRGDVQYFWEEGREPHRGGLDSTLETMLYCLTFVSLSGYLYFPNNVKDIEDHI